MFAMFNIQTSANKRKIVKFDQLEHVHFLMKTTVFSHTETSEISNLIKDVDSDEQQNHSKIINKSRQNSVCK